MEPLSHSPIPLWTPELAASFALYVPAPDPVTGCQNWTGQKYTTGYGRFYIPSGEKGRAGRQYRAHRVAYAWKYGDPGEAVLDHLCHDPLLCIQDEHGWCSHRACVNVEHLGLSTRGENVRRGLPGSPLWSPAGNSNKTHCDHGHEFTPENTYIAPGTGWRQCRTCKAATAVRNTEANRDRINARRRTIREHITYDPRPCQLCGTVYQPKRSDSRFCLERACINERQRINRDGRLGR
jgi:hypothetical protein